MSIRKKSSARSNVFTKFLDFLLKYWVIFAGIITGLYVLYQYSSKPYNSQEEINNIRINYSELLDLSSRIVASLEQNKNIDSLNIEFEIAYGKFIPFKKDKSVFMYLRDFRLELRDFRMNRSNIEKLTYRQRCLLTSISEELKKLQ